MWLCLAAGDARSFGGHGGYDDDPSSRYVSDDRVPNTTRLRAGDVIVVWDKKTALGVSVIDRVDPGRAPKTLYKCPQCGRTGIKRRSNRLPLYRCQTSCGFEFDVPDAETVPVTTYSTFHEPGWIALDGALSAQQLRELCVSPRSQHSIRELDPLRTYAAIGGALLRAVAFARTDYGWGELRGGHRERTVRARLGQDEFRQRLVRHFGEVCVFSGSAPLEALEAAHLYSYAAIGRHREHGGLLLRRDLHRLFDGGLVGVEPGAWRLRMSRRAFESDSYQRLDRTDVGPRLNDQHKYWLREHWLQHDLARESV